MKHATLVAFGSTRRKGIRAEEDKDILDHFTSEQHRIRNEWRANRAKKVAPDNMAAVLDQLKNAFISLAGGDIH